VEAREDCPKGLLGIAVPRSMSVYFLTGFHAQSLVRCIAGSSRLSGLGMPWLLSGDTKYAGIDNR
jgi:hypothetical protein